MATTRAGAGDLLAAEAVRVACAVPALVAGADGRSDLLEPRCGGDDSLADQGVLPHQRPLRRVERARLVEDRVRDRQLADVVKLRGDADELALGR